MTKQTLFHVGIENPEKLRRYLLEATRATISCLQRYEKFKSVREEKIEALDEFAHHVKEIYRLDSKLNAILPKIGVQKKAPAPKEPAKGKRVVKRPRPKPMHSDLETLEKDLAMIDDALSKLK